LTRLRRRRPAAHWMVAGRLGASGRVAAWNLPQCAPREVAANYW